MCGLEVALIKGNGEPFLVLFSVSLCLKLGTDDEGNTLRVVEQEDLGAIVLAQDCFFC